MINFYCCVFCKKKYSSCNKKICSMSYESIGSPWQFIRKHFSLLSTCNQSQLELVLLLLPLFFLHFECVFIYMYDFMEKLGRFVVGKHCLKSHKINGCSNLASFVLSSTTISNLWLSDLHSYSIMVLFFKNALT